MRIGFHMPFSGSLNKLRERVVVSRGNTFQVYARSLRGGKLQSLKKKPLQEFHEFLEKKDINPIIVHAPYVYNLAKAETEDVEKILEDLVFAEQIRAPYYVLQPGYSKGIHPIEAIENIKTHLLHILEKTEWYGEILIKNMAGAGSEVGSNLQEWNELVSFHPQVKGAMDFSRAYSAGYDFTTKEEAELFIEEIEEVVCWDKIKLVYIQDNERGCGSKKNYFPPLGEGVIGFQGYEHVLANDIIKEKIWLVENQPEIDYYDRSISYLTGFFLNTKEGK